MSKVNILGTQWTVEERSVVDDRNLENCDGYCDWTTRTIVIEREIESNFGDAEAYVRKVKRHEIVHAFLEECGLAECASAAEAWARHEEMVDWFARLGPKIYEAWNAANAL